MFLLLSALLSSMWIKKLGIGKFTIATVWSGRLATALTSSPLCRKLQPSRPSTCSRGNLVCRVGLCLQQNDSHDLYCHRDSISLIVVAVLYVCPQTSSHQMGSMLRSSLQCTSFKTSTLRARVAFRSLSGATSMGQSLKHDTAGRVNIDKHMGFITLCVYQQEP